MFDADVAPFDPSERRESLLKGSDASLVLRIAVGKSVQKGDPAHSSARLRGRRQRPRCRRAAEQRDELAPVHSITPSARACRVIGTVRPSAFAVLRLIARAKLVGACTGRSAGFSPLRMRSTYDAERR